MGVHPNLPRGLRMATHPLVSQEKGNPDSYIEYGAQRLVSNAIGTASIVNTITERILVRRLLSGKLSASISVWHSRTLILGVRTERSAKETPAEVAREQRIRKTVSLVHILLGPICLPGQTLTLSGLSASREA